jgi:hypothetical protein
MDELGRVSEILQQAEETIGSLRRTVTYQDSRIQRLSPQAEAYRVIRDMMSLARNVDVAEYSDSAGVAARAEDMQNKIQLQLGRIEKIRAAAASPVDGTTVAAGGEVKVHAGGAGGGGAGVAPKGSARDSEGPAVPTPTAPRVI